MCRSLLMTLTLLTAFACSGVRPYSAPRACLDIDQADVHHAAFLTVMERGWRLIDNDEERGVVDAVEKTGDRNRRVHWTFFVARPLVRVRRTVESRDGAQRGAPWVSSSTVPEDYDFNEERAVLAEVAERVGGVAVERCSLEHTSIARMASPAN